MSWRPYQCEDPFTQCFLDNFSHQVQYLAPAAAWNLIVKYCMHPGVLTHFSDQKCTHTATDRTVGVPEAVMGLLPQPGIDELDQWSRAWMELREHIRKEARLSGFDVPDDEGIHHVDLSGPLTSLPPLPSALQTQDEAVQAFDLLAAVTVRLPDGPPLPSASDEPPSSAPLPVPAFLRSWLPLQIADSCLDDLDTVNGAGSLSPPRYPDLPFASDSPRGFDADEPFVPGPVPALDPALYSPELAYMGKSSPIPVPKAPGGKPDGSYEWRAA